MANLARIFGIDRARKAKVGKYWRLSYYHHFEKILRVFKNIKRLSRPCKILIRIEKVEQELRTANIPRYDSQELATLNSWIQMLQKKVMIGRKRGPEIKMYLCIKGFVFSTSDIFWKQNPFENYSYQTKVDTCEKLLKKSMKWVIRIGSVDESQLHEVSININYIFIEQTG